VRRFLSIAICGIPNAGKSSLVNALMEQNVVGVSSKVQTTRSNVRCVITEGDKQLVFVDTPGVFIPKRFLEKKLVRNANNGMESADLACLVIDAQRGLDKTSLDLLNRFAKDCKEAIAVINKVDIAREADILCLGKQLFETGLIKEQFFISATKGRGISELKQYFFDNVRAQWAVRGGRNCRQRYEFYHQRPYQGNAFWLVKQGVAIWCKRGDRKYFQ
jgi:GTP-binding protein Era